MKSYLQTAGWVVMTYFALATGAKSLTYLSGDPWVFDPVFREKYIAHWPVIFTHGICSISVLVIGPFQFLSGLRMRWPTLHRVLGRVYMLGILLGGIAGFRMGMMAFGGPAARIAFCLIATLWVFTGFKAVAAARARRFPEHRAWMIRNYALTFGAVMLRVELAGLEWMGWEFEVIYPYLTWLAWAPNLFIAQLIIGRSNKATRAKWHGHPAHAHGRDAHATAVPPTIVVGIND